MWIVAGNLMAAGLVLRRSVTLPVPDYVAFRQALDQAASKLKLVVLAETTEVITLGPRRVLFRLPVQETRVELGDGQATVSGPLLSFWAVKRAANRAVAEGLSADSATGNRVERS